MQYVSASKVVSVESLTVSLSAYEIGIIGDALTNYGYSYMAEDFYDMVNKANKPEAKTCEDYALTGVVDSLIRDTKKIAAIKAIRCLVPGATLKEAKDAVDNRANYLIVG